MTTQLEQLAVLYCGRCGRMVLADELTDGAYQDSDEPITCRTCAREMAAGKSRKRATPRTGGGKRISSRRLNKAKGSGRSTARTSRSSRSVSSRRGGADKGLFLPVAVVAVGLSLAAVVAMLVLNSSQKERSSGAKARPSPSQVVEDAAAAQQPVAPAEAVGGAPSPSPSPLPASSQDSDVYGAGQPEPEPESESARSEKADDGMLEYQRQLKELAKQRAAAKTSAVTDSAPASATFAVFDAPAAGRTIRINSGPGSVPGWEDGSKYITGGLPYWFGGAPSLDGVEHAAPAGIYRSCQHFDHSYNVNVPDGRYTVRLHFYDEQGQDRHMSYTIEGRKVLSDFCMPFERASVRSFDVSVCDGNGMQIEARKDHGSDAFECGVEIIPRDGASTAAPVRAKKAKPRVDPDDAPTAEVVTVEGDLMVNGSFEKRDTRGRFAARWATYQWGEEGARFSTRLDRTVSRSGEVSVVVRNLSEEARGGFYQTVTIEPGVYELSFWACADIDGTAVVSACVVEGMELSTSVGEEWKLIKNTITIKKRKRNASLRLWTQTPMLRTWFDDVVLKKVGDLDEDE